ncbi:hypothetical protein HanXRQr2_Chr04g0154441 [Helianthus annuus]|uniref:DUF4283 domain-containing protein n=1 Tax=Helianthus annuus TaxID=4232 RepID=A0A9K3NRH2_HELAN|nr:hypothetical protein HanXRQr2_Chr04g0154441 [Helianthus annuus]KAJ0580241.1 hypothetical protein HanHA300_Chr04g0126961 [Helianthus annuus]KAJ0587719.1 hypothetical protein HanIR_Chr04g0166391 [Helianthus annuus]
MGGSSHNRNFSSSVKGGMSYKESLMGREKKDGKEDKVVEISAYVKPLEEWSKSSLIIRVSDLTTLVNLDKILSEAIGPNIKLKYVGGFYMLLLFEKVEYLYEFRDFNPNLKVWFSWFEVWKGQILPFEQIAWLKISGVPLHVLDKDVFDSVGRLYSKVVHASALNGDDKDLSFDLVGILVGDGEKISDRVTLMWKDKKFKVWVEGESSDWTPDCISDDGSWSDAEVSDGAQGEDCNDTGFSSPDMVGKSPVSQKLQPEVEKIGGQCSNLVEEVVKVVNNDVSKSNGPFCGWNMFENIEEGEIPMAFNVGRNVNGKGNKSNVFSRLGRPHVFSKGKKAQAQGGYSQVPGGPKIKKKKNGGRPSG